MTKRGELQPVLDGLFAAKAAGFQGIKINVVVVRGINEDEIGALVEFGRQHGFEMRSRQKTRPPEGGRATDALC